MPDVWTPLKLIRWTTDFFKKKGIPNPRLDAELLLAHVLKCPRIELYTDHDRRIADKDLAKYRAFVERRAKREPLQYILKETEFWGLKITVTPDVLIPRPETELLVEEAIKIVGAGFSRPGREDRAPTGIQILDIGTGSGSIAVALAKELPKAKVIATDISKEALALARENAEMNGVIDRIDFILADLAPWKRFQAEDRLFDLIVSNPPYIATNDFPTLQPEVRDFEPRRALDGGPDGFSMIRTILKEAPAFLRPGGFLLMELGENQGEKIKKELKPATFKRDYAGIERILIATREIL